MLSARDLGWIAGIVEGEGCFQHRYGSTAGRRAGTHQGSFMLLVAMTDRDVMERFARLVDGKLHGPTIRKVGNKPMYSVNLAGRAAVQWAFTLYSLLGERRRAKIRDGIAKWKLQRGHSRDRTECPAGHPLSGTNLVVRELRNGKQARVCRACAYVHGTTSTKARPPWKAREYARRSYWRRVARRSDAAGQLRLA